MDESYVQSSGSCIQGPCIYASFLDSQSESTSTSAYLITSHLINLLSLEAFKVNLPTRASHECRFHVMGRAISRSSEGEEAVSSSIAVTNPLSDAKTTASFDIGKTAVPAGQVVSGIIMNTDFPECSELLDVETSIGWHVGLDFPDLASWGSRASAHMERCSESALEEGEDEEKGDGECVHL